ncbi:MAG: DUF4145 domain-containing protein [Acidimicrobiia bacterium]|nr:DUF4145 domain-containing protein [Acidimicrobiia bacterium]MYC46359.1 DUF4145 domain-containing protein [Acidimicrobiia bacterium]MYI19411.1 DUF4145 domain-containing protein [Acidimicrobiia bacterium]
MPNQEITWGQPGTCPSCGVLTEHTWFYEIYAPGQHQRTGETVPRVMSGGQGKLQVSQCPSPACKALALWLAETDHQAGSVTRRLVYPQTGVRIPPAEGLEVEEARLYEEAAAIGRLSPRAACALVRALLEVYLQRHLHNAGFTVEGKRLAEVIDMAVEHLDLSKTLKSGLSAIRTQGNAVMHNPFGLPDDVYAEQLPWLFRAVDTLVLELDVTPQKWADIVAN